MKKLILTALVFATAFPASAGKLNPRSSLEKAILVITTPRDVNNSDVKTVISLSESEQRVEHQIAGGDLLVKATGTEAFELPLKRYGLTPTDLSGAVLFIRFPKDQNLARER